MYEEVLLTSYLVFSGTYVYIETSAPRRTGDKARLISPQVTNTQAQCLQFYYHMYGQNIGTLNIYVQTGNTLPIASVWSRTFNQGNNWIKGLTTIQASQPYNVSQ